jgi:hypothetical protein
VPGYIGCMAGRYDNPMPASTRSPQSGTKNMASGCSSTYRLAGRYDNPMSYSNIYPGQGLRIWPQDAPVPSATVLDSLLFIPNDAATVIFY